MEDIKHFQHKRRYEVVTVNDEPVAVFDHEPMEFLVTTEPLSKKAIDFIESTFSGYRGSKVSRSYLQHKLGM